MMEQGDNMSKVITDIDSFLTAATAIDDYVANCKKRDNDLQRLQEELASAWRGPDQLEFRNKFQEIILGSESNNTQLIDYLEQFSQYLRKCAKQYSSAQKNAQDKFSRC